MNTPTPTTPPLDQEKLAADLQAEVCELKRQLAQREDQLRSALASVEEWKASFNAIRVDRDNPHTE